jgi:hypothetical protein
MPVLLGRSIEGVEPGEKATAMGVFQAVYALVWISHGDGRW